MPFFVNQESDFNAGRARGVGISLLLAGLVMVCARVCSAGGYGTIARFGPLRDEFMSGTLIAGAIVLGVVIIVAMAVAVAVRPDDPRRRDSQGPPSF